MTAGQLAGRFSHSWPTTTRHLRELESAGLIQCKPVGRERHYLLDRERLLGVTELWFGVFRDTSGSSGTPRRHPPPNQGPGAPP
jgi:DNA-binding transcriptional ArsR family regulator